MPATPADPSCSPPERIRGIGRRLQGARAPAGQAGSDRWLSGARHDQAAIALGGHGEYVMALADLDAALTRAIASEKPACVNVAIEGLPAPAGSAD